MDETISLDLDVGDIVARILREMEEIVALIQRPVASAYGPATSPAARPDLTGPDLTGPDLAETASDPIM